MILLQLAALSLQPLGKRCQVRWLGLMNLCLAPTNHKNFPKNTN